MTYVTVKKKRKKKRNRVPSSTGGGKTARGRTRNEFFCAPRATAMNGDGVSGWSCTRISQPTTTTR